MSAPTGTTRERQLQHTSLTLGKATTCSPDQGQTITLPTVCNPTNHTGGDHQRRWRLLAITFTVSESPSGNTPGANNPSSRSRETIGTLVSINGSHSRRGKGVGWVAFPPPHITVCSLYIVAVGRLICGSLLVTAGRGLLGWTERKTA